MKVVKIIGFWFLFIVITQSYLVYKAIVNSYYYTGVKMVENDNGKQLYAEYVIDYSGNTLEKNVIIPYENVERYFKNNNSRFIPTIYRYLLMLSCVLFLVGLIIIFIYDINRPI